MELREISRALRKIIDRYFQATGMSINLEIIALSLIIVQK
jgi:hypothetical protein